MYRIVRELYYCGNSAYLLLGSHCLAIPPWTCINNEYNCENGIYKYYNIPIKDHKKHGMLTVPQIFYFSSNIGTIKMVEEIGARTLYTFSRDLGFGQKTGISLDGEVAGKLKPTTEWSAISLGQIAMGHEVGVTALQMASAYSAIANGGYLLKPRIIKEFLHYYAKL